MLCARATLVAGSGHARYPRGTTVRAVVFADCLTPDELKEFSFSPLKQRGWSRMIIDGYAKLANNHAFATAHSAEAQAFRAARESGIGIVVLGTVQ